MLLSSLSCDGVVLAQRTALTAYSLPHGNFSSKSNFSRNGRASRYSPIPGTPSTGFQKARKRAEPPLYMRKLSAISSTSQSPKETRPLKSPWPNLSSWDPPRAERAPSSLPATSSFPLVPLSCPCVQPSLCAINASALLSPFCPLLSLLSLIHPAQLPHYTRTTPLERLLAHLHSTPFSTSDSLAGVSLVSPSSSPVDGTRQKKQPKETGEPTWALSRFCARRLL